MIPPAKRGGNKRTVNVREVVNGLTYVLRTDCQWRAIPKDLPPRSTVRDFLDLWDYDGTLDVASTLYVQCRQAADREASPTAAIIDSQSVEGAEKAERAWSHGLRSRLGWRGGGLALKTANLWLDAALADLTHGLCIFDSVNELKVFNLQAADEMLELSRGRSLAISHRPLDESFWLAPRLLRRADRSCAGR